MSFSKKHTEAPSTLAPASGLATSQVPPNLQSQSQSQSHLKSSQKKQQTEPVCPWSAHALPSGQSPSPYLRYAHSLSTSATTVSELFLFGGYIHSSKSRSNDLYVISTRDFSTTLLQTSGDVPSPRYGHCAVLTGASLLIWGGKTDFGNENAQNQSHDNSFYLLNLGTLDIFDVKTSPADQSFLRSSITRVDPHRGPWSRARRSLVPYHEVDRFQALRLRWPLPHEAI